MSKLATIPGFVRVGGRLLKKSDIILIEENVDIYNISLVITMSGKQNSVELEGERIGDFIKKMKRGDEDG